MRGYKVLAIGLSAVVAFTFAACDDKPTEPEAQATQLQADSHLAGNDFPKGGHDYKLNIIGVEHGKSVDMDNNKGHRIFVMLNGGETVTNGGGKWKKNTSWDDPNLDKTNKILLTKGDDFQVLDANATDMDPSDDGAEFQLPDPDVGNDGNADYYVYARALGSGGNVTITTCADEEGTGFDASDDIWCGSNEVNLARDKSKGPPKAVDVTENLLKMTITVDGTADPELAACLDANKVGGQATIGDGVATVDRWLFDACFENYFWNYDNNGLKLLELRFYAP